MGDVLPRGQGARTTWRAGTCTASATPAATGTALWIEPNTGTWMVLLTNRVYEPRRDTDMTGVRRRVYERLTGQVDE